MIACPNKTGIESLHPVYRGKLIGLVNLATKNNHNFMFSCPIKDTIVNVRCKYKLNPAFKGQPLQRKNIISRKEVKTLTL